MSIYDSCSRLELDLLGLDLEAKFHYHPVMNPKTVIAIDGPAASGKGTLARKLAERLNFSYLDTGAIYRLVAFWAQKDGISPDDLAGLIPVAKRVSTDSRPADFINPNLRTDQIGSMTSKISAYPEIRSILLQFQRDFATQGGPDRKAGSILDGRDIGTIICPEADVKLYITATVEARAQRRLKELQDQGIPVTYDSVLEEMRARDARDMGRTVAPLKPAVDAIILDTSELSREESFLEALLMIEQKIGRI
jgi:cytidylate kinase